jgi:hypothetical protein
MYIDCNRGDRVERECDVHADDLGITDEDGAVVLEGHGDSTKEEEDDDDDDDDSEDSVEELP